VLLPHGYDGQGPEHSSGRLERFLQLVDDDEDAIPGKSAFSKAEMQSGFDAISSLKSRSGGVLDRAELGRILSRLSPGASAERIELTLAEIMAETGTSGDEVLTKDDWCRLMEAWHLRNSERKVNLVVVVPSTPAQYFHCLRRQIHRPFSKPLVCFSGKWLLHHKHCVSRLDDLAAGTFFQRLIVEGGLGDNMRGSGMVSGSEAQQLEKQQLGGRVQMVDDEKIRRVIFCSGKVFYHLFHAREASSHPLAGTITLVRLEQIAPFPYDLVGPTLARFSNADICWVQEEPKNMGAWAYVRPRLQTCMRENGLPIKPILYRGRKPSSSPASGGYTVHIAEQKVFVEAALRLEE
jgi:2-oxoglutarate dehydrogenase E1 component